MEEENKRQEEKPLGDIYDLYGLVSSVHSKSSDMNKDYVLAQYTSEIINAKFPKFIREQRKLVKIIKSFLVISQEELEKEFRPEKAKEINKRLEEIYKEIEILLIGELDEMVIISRAGKGQITKAMLLHGKGREEEREFEDEVGESTIKERLLERRK